MTGVIGTYIFILGTGSWLVGALPVRGLVGLGLVQEGDLLGAQLEVVDLKIALQPLHRARLGQRHVAVLQRPADQHLARVAADLLGDAHDVGVLDLVAVRERREGLDHQSLGLAVVGQVLAHDPGRDLDLVDHGLVLELFPREQLVDVVLAVVGHADGAHDARVDGLLHGFVGLETAARAAERRVDQQHVDVSEGTHLVEALLDRALGVGVPVLRVPQLGRVEHVVAAVVLGVLFEPLLNAFSDLALVSVQHRGVEVPVAGLERLIDHFCGLCSGDVVRAEPEAGQHVSAGKFVCSWYAGGRHVPWLGLAWREGRVAPGGLRYILVAGAVRDACGPVR